MDVLLRPEERLHNLISPPGDPWRHRLNSHSHFEAAEKSSYSFLFVDNFDCIGNTFISQVVWFMRRNTHSHLWGYFPIQFLSNGLSFFATGLVQNLTNLSFLTRVVHTCLSVKSCFYHIEGTSWDRSQASSQTCTQEVLEVRIVITHFHQVLYFLIEEDDHCTERNVHCVVHTKTSVKREDALVFVHLRNKLSIADLSSMRAQQLQSLFHDLSRCHYYVVEKRRSYSHSNKLIMVLRAFTP